MLADSWLIFSIIASFMAAVSFGINAHLKADGILLSFWRSVFSLILLAPVIWFLPWPESHWFYYFAFITGTLGIIADMFMYKAVAIHGSGPCLRLLNLRIPMGVALGWILFPASWFAMGENPYIFSGIVLSIILCGLALFYMRKSAVAHAALLAMLFPVVLYVLTDVAQKKSILLVPDVNGIITFLFFMNVSMVIVSGLSCLAIKRTCIESKIFKNASIVTAVWLALVALKTAALIGIPNPGYYSVFMGLSAVWAMAYNKWKGIPDHASPIAGVFLVIGAIILAYCVSLIS